MQEPLLRLIARFDINEERGHVLDGRAYLSAYNFPQAYHSDLIDAVKKLREVVKGDELRAVKERGFNHTVALMWGDSQGNKMIDWLGWQYKTWEENAEISCWQTKNGVLVPVSDGIAPVTCEGGLEILHAEEQYRHNYGPTMFRNLGPEIPHSLRFDFCTPNGREELKELIDARIA